MLNLCNCFNRCSGRWNTYWRPAVVCDASFLNTRLQCGRWYDESFRKPACVDATSTSRRPCGERFKYLVGPVVHLYCTRYAYVDCHVAVAVRNFIQRKYWPRQLALIIRLFFRISNMGVWTNPWGLLHRRKHCKSRSRVWAESPSRHWIWCILT